MRLICPHCMSGVTVSDDAAGQEAACPNCGKSFPTPARYSAAVVPEAPAPTRVPEVAPMPAVVPSQVQPVPPPGLVPPAPVAQSGFLPPASAVAAEAPAPVGYARSCGITISPHVVSWLPAVLLLLTLALTVFPWVGSYAGGSAVYSQRPWGAMFGAVSRNFGLEKAVIIPAGWMDKVRSDWELMLPYLLLLILATVLAWADRGMHALDPRKIPPLAKIWPHRQTVICVLAGFAFVLAILQVSNGFGMERAIRKQVAEKFAKAREEAAGSQEKHERIEYEVEIEYKTYNLERTTWMYLALLFNLLAVLAVVARLILDRRGNKPPPKLLLHY